MPRTAHAAARKPEKVIPAEPKQNTRYRVSALRQKDQDYSASSKDAAITEGCRLIGTRKPYTAASFQRAGGVGIYELPSMDKIWPPTHH